MVLGTEIHGLGNKGAVYVVHPSQSHNLIRSTFFLAQKKPDLCRPILNLSPLSKVYISTKRFRVETLSSIIPTLLGGIWTTAIDLADTYFHIPIHHQHQNYLAFRNHVVDFSFIPLLFGLAMASRVFTHVTRAVLAFLRRNSILLFAYLDDCLILGNSREQASHDTLFMICTLQDLR